MKLIKYIFSFSLSIVGIIAYGQTKIGITEITLNPEGLAEIISPITNIKDGKAQNDREIFHTLWSGIDKQEITIEASLDGKGKRLDRIKLYPRGIGMNGIIKSAEIFVMLNNKYKKITDLNDLPPTNTPITVDLEFKAINPQRIKIVVKDAYSSSSDKDKYFVSLGELGCLMLPEGATTMAQLKEDEKFFSHAGTQLDGQRDLSRIKTPKLKNLAEQIQEKVYVPGLLYSAYEAFQSPQSLGEKMHIGDGFSRLEGITGVILPKGENIIFVGDTHGTKISLVIPEWTRKAPKGLTDPSKDPKGWGLKKDSYVLREGINLIEVEKEGLAYIQYFVTDDPANHEPIYIHFVDGIVNGYFDITRGDDNKVFNSLLDNAKSPILDMRGKYIQVAFPVKSLKKLTYNQGVELIQNFDSIVGLQRHFIGWDKEGLFPKNHVLARINYHYYMFRDQDGVAYIDWAMPMVAVPSNIIQGDPCWGFSHELGHVLQMRPQLTWGGMTEVSNNIMTLYSTTMLGNRSRLSTEDTYTKARRAILDKGISYMNFSNKVFEANPDGSNKDTDVFHRLVPFWQLYLYFAEQGYPDFYADLMIALRHQDPLGDNDRSLQYLNMLEFCRLACEVSQTDLTDFFERWGFFYVGEINVNDYVPYKYNVSQEDVDRTKQAIADMKLPRPVKDITLMED